MMMALEYFDIFTSDNEPLHLIKERSKVHRDGDWHRTAQIWIINNRKEILCNLRSLNKDVFAGHWDLSVGGHVASGDTYENTAIRELKEEVGIIVSLSDLQFLSDEKIDGVDKEKQLVDREHARLFLYSTEKDISKFVRQVEEIEELKFIPIPILIADIRSENPNFKVVPTKHFYTKILERLSCL